MNFCFQSKYSFYFGKDAERRIMLRIAAPKITKVLFFIRILIIIKEIIYLFLRTYRKYLDIRCPSHVITHFLKKTLLFNMNDFTLLLLLWNFHGPSQIIQQMILSIRKISIITINLITISSTPLLKEIKKSSRRIRKRKIISKKKHWIIHFIGKIYFALMKRNSYNL